MLFKLYVPQLCEDTVLYGSLMFEFCLKGFVVLFSFYVDDGKYPFNTLISWSGLKSSNVYILYSCWNDFDDLACAFQMKCEQSTFENEGIYYGRLSFCIM